MEPQEIAAGVYCLATRWSNVYFVRSGTSWVLIDAGWGDCGRVIRQAAESLFGPPPPAAVLLTHAHPDHYGAAAELARLWGLPVCVHADDVPMLCGETHPGDVDPIGRVFLAVVCLLPARLRERITSTQFRDIACALPESRAEVPGLPGWRCVPTPGHSPGHVVFFRDSDRVAIVGDAVLTAGLSGLLPAWHKLSPPLRMVSSDWRCAMESVGAVAALEPRVLATGHGRPMSGDAVAGELRAFAARCSRPASDK